MNVQTPEAGASRSPEAHIGASDRRNCTSCAPSGLVAWMVYDFIGLAVLRRSWINLDLIWCFSLLGVAAILFFVPLA